jgi:hypothetical protein
MAEDAAGSAEHARRRADEAGERARRLRARRLAVGDGDRSLRGTSREELDAAVERAEQATERLRDALEASADAHDRAAAAYDEQIRRYGDTDGTRGVRAADHRRDAAADRDRAAETLKPECPVDEPGAGHR